MTLQDKRTKKVYKAETEKISVSEVWKTLDELEYRGVGKEVCVDNLS